MKKYTILLLRVSYWLGAVVDLVAGLIMVVPALYRTFNQLPGFEPDASFMNMAGMGAPLMFGWTVLLLWADRKPVERKAVLLITLIPLVGNALNQVLGVVNGFNSLSAAIPQWIMQACLITLFSLSYGLCVRQERSMDKK